MIGQGEPYETEPLRPIVSSHVMLVGVAETEKEIGEVAALSDAVSATDEVPYEKELLEMLMGQGEPYETEPLRPIVSSHVMLVGVAETEKEIGEVAASSDAVSAIDEAP